MLICRTSPQYCEGSLRYRISFQYRPARDRPPILQAAHRARLALNRFRETFIAQFAGIIEDSLVNVMFPSSIQTVISISGSSFSAARFSSLSLLRSFSLPITREAPLHTRTNCADALPWRGVHRTSMLQPASAFAVFTF